MPRARFDVQRTVVIPWPLASPCLSRVGSRERRPYRSGWLELGQVQTGRGEEGTPIRLRCFTRRVFFLRRKRFEVRETALWIELDVDHARHGRLGIVLLDGARNEHLITQAEGEHGIGALAIPEFERRRTAASDLV